MSQNVVDALAFLHQSFRQVWYKSAADCMRNANNVQKSPILQRPLHFVQCKSPLFCNGEENEKVIRNPHADLDHH